MPQASQHMPSRLENGGTRQTFDCDLRRWIQGYPISSCTLVATAGGLHRLHQAQVIPDSSSFGRFIQVAPGLLTLSGLKRAWLPGGGAILAIGGGSVLDAAKILLLCDALGCEPSDNLFERYMEVQEAAPLICVPTTVGSGSEITPTAAVWDDRTKRSFDAPILQPAAALYDPSLLRTSPLDVLVASAWDATSHALEALWSRRSTSLSTDDALGALRVLVPALIGRQAGLLEQLDQIQRAGAIAGRAIAVTRTGIGHALSYELTARHGLPHGLAASLFCLAVAPIVIEQENRIGRTLADALRCSRFEIHDLLLEAWISSGANTITGRYVTPGDIQQSALVAPNPERADLSVIKPDRELICSFAAGLLRGSRGR